VTNEVRNLGMVTMADMLARLPVEVDRRSKLRDAVKRELVKDIAVMNQDRYEALVERILDAVEGQP